MIAEGRAPAPAASRISSFVQADATALPFADGEFDTVTMSFGLRNVNEPKKALRELLRVTKPGGRLVVCEFSHPPSRAFNGLYRFYNDRVLPVVAKTVSSNADAYDYLNESISDWPDQRTLSAWIREAGWTDVAYRNLSFGIVALHRAQALIRPAPRRRRGAPVGCDRDSLSAGLASRGQAGPHRPHLRRSSVSPAARDGRGGTRAGRSPPRAKSCASPTRSPTRPAAISTRRAASACGPMLALLTAQLGDGATDEVIEGATALEMTHLGSLYHDDVMDAADKRRGVPSAHAVWGNSIAILTGDLLFSRASQIMARHGDRAIRLQADTFERLVLGQMHETVGPAGGR